MLIILYATEQIAPEITDLDSDLVSDLFFEKEKRKESPFIADIC